ncbi:hypothetical protein PsAD5_02530 [Pseudovibrio sp. Ad5]|uniref:DUF6950 family protein n=1 Tax=Pseudovibrio sp. Ad5 TaxID=989436 RepID=UPI0007AE3C36|nr:hypothetical protein [Pseudovibrio sp. Ad5]KZK96343.1 hypothetical protein PsAD5_02530 [Pseudovibrio sp. Ad5]
MSKKPLQIYFQHVYAKGFGYQPNRVDCCRFPADWIVFCGGPDPAAHWRGRYETEDQALAFVHEAGGLVNILDLGMTSAGLQRVGEPRSGDVGCIVARACRSVVGAIFCDDVWWTISELGVLPVSARCLRVWRIPECQWSCQR